MCTHTKWEKSWYYNQWTLCLLWKDLQRNTDGFLSQCKEKSDPNTKTNRQFYGMKWLVQKLTQWGTMKRNHWIHVFPFSHLFYMILLFIFKSLCLSWSFILLWMQQKTWILFYKKQKRKKAGNSGKTLRHNSSNSSCYNTSIFWWDLLAAQGISKQL